mmetsp:Transcript_41597/g.75414  ORF Transcript_41597/g.75414 Transcript_41597/m.75414 type:complete len:233 (-) Transcript_41597:57-755(-)
MDAEMSNSPRSSLRAQALAQVSRHGYSLRNVAEDLKADHEIVLAAVKESGSALQFASEACQGDREIVLSAVRKCGPALQYAADCCKADRELVLVAVEREGWALQFAAEVCQADPEVVLAALQQFPFALSFCSEELLLDSSFAAEAKERCFILKISLLSGRYTYRVTGRNPIVSACDILRWCCKRLGLCCSGSEALIHGTTIVPSNAIVEDWPGIQPLGQISEYQLVVGVRKQ